jgi:hypothetical protein
MGPPAGHTEQTDGVAGCSSQQAAWSAGAVLGPVPGQPLNLRVSEVR